MKERKALQALVSSCLLLLLLSTAAAQDPNSSSTQRDNDKAALYTRYYEAKKIATPEQQRMAYDLAQQYLKEFGNENDKYTEAVRKYVAGYEKAIGEYELNQAYLKKNYAKVFADGTAMLVKEPDNYFVLAVLSQAGYDASATGDASRNKETLEHARHALRLLDSPDLQTAEPFKDVDSARAFLNFAIGWLLRNDSPAEAATALRKAVEPNSVFRTDPGVYSLLGVMIVKGEYEPKAAKYNEDFGNKPPSPEQQAALDQLDQIGARAIDAYARAVALSSKPEQKESRAKLLSQLTDLYKSFHKDSEEGLNELIASVLSKPIP